jgi:hypothetical protein
VLCSALADGVPAEIQVFPAGTHTVHASRGGQPVTLTIEIGPDTAKAMQDSLAEALHCGLRPYFDFDHSGGCASAWPTRYRWQPGGAGLPPGVYAAVEWSAAGREAITGRNYRSFSPEFHVDDGNPCHVTGAPLSQGGLVNDPAFEAIKPIWAKAARSDETAHAETRSREDNQTNTTRHNRHMKEIAKALGLAEDATTEAILAAIAELAAQAPDDAAGLQAQLQGALAERDAALAAKAAAETEAVKARAAAALLAPATTAAKAEVKDGLVESLRAYNAAPGHRERARIYARSVRPQLRHGDALGPILAANALGALSGDIVVQRAFDLLRDQYPWLAKVTTDFSDEGANYGQTIKTRAKTALAAVDYTPGTGYTRASAATPDIAITLDQHKGCEVSFNANELSGTHRDLIGEQAEVVMAAIGDALAAAVISKITAAAFATAPVTTAAGTATRATMTALAKQLSKNKALLRDRFVLLNLDCYESLGNDAAIVALAAAQRAELIEEFRLPQVGGLQPYGVNLFPTATAAGTLQGFAGTPASLALATRLPGDYAAGNAGNGTVRTVQSDMGIAVQLVDYVDHRLAERSLRAALIFGAAAGVGAAGVRLTVQS